MSLKSVVNSYPTPTRHQLAAEGSYLVATNPTVSTGLTWVAAQTAFSDTTPNFYILNNEPASGGKSLNLDYLKLVSTTVGTAAVSWQYAVITDTAPRSLTTDNTLAIIPVSSNTDGVNMTLPTVKAQNSATASVISASSSAKRLVARGALGGLNIAAHEYLIAFGDLSTAMAYVGNTDAAGAPGRSTSASGPVIIGPGHCATIYVWGPSSSAALAPEFELGMWFR